MQDVFLELPETGTAIHTGEPFGVVESVKTASDLFAPLSGTVAEANSALEEAPELVNDSCYEDGWILRVKPTEPEEIEALLTLDEYRKSVAERSD